MYFLPVKFNQESNLLTGLAVHFRMSGNVLRQVGFEGFRIVALNGDADQFSGCFFEVNIYDG